MGNQDGGLARPGIPEVLEDGGLGLGIDGGDGIVQDQDGGLLHQSTGDGDALLLAAGDGDAALAQHGLIAQLELGNIAVHVRQLRCVDDGVPLVGVGSEGDVGGDGVGEEEIILGHVGTARTDIVDGNGVDIPAIDKNRAVGDVVGPQEQVHQGGLACAGLAHQTDVLARMDRKGHILQGVVVGVGIAEGQAAEFDVTAHIGQGLHILPVLDGDFRIQQLADADQGCLAAGDHVDELRHRHDGPHHGGEVAQELDEHASVEGLVINQPAAVAQDDADDGFHKKGNQHTHQHRRTGKVDIGVFIFHIQLLEGHQFLGFLDESLDDRNAGEALLGEVRQPGECFLTGVPLFRQVLAQQGGSRHQGAHGDQGQDGQEVVHPPHVGDGQHRHEDRIEEHHGAPGHTLLNGVQIVGEEAHEVAHLVDLVILPAQVPCPVEHPVTKALFDLDAHAEEADAPQEAAHHQGQDDQQHGEADFVQQDVHAEGRHHSIDLHHAGVQSVDDDAVELGNDHLAEVHRIEGQNAKHQPAHVLQIVTVDMLAEYHCWYLFLSFFCYFLF